MVFNSNNITTQTSQTHPLQSLASDVNVSKKSIEILKNFKNTEFLDLVQKTSPFCGSNALHIAARFNNIMFAEIIANKLPPQEVEKLLAAQDNFRSNVLHIAAKLNHIKFVEFIANKFPHQFQNLLNTPDSIGKTAFSYAEKFKPLHNFIKNAQNKIASSQDNLANKSIEPLSYAVRAKRQIESQTSAQDQPTEKRRKRTAEKTASSANKKQVVQAQTSVQPSAQPLPSEQSAPALAPAPDLPAKEKICNAYLVVNWGGIMSRLGTPTKEEIENSKKMEEPFPANLLIKDFDMSSSVQASTAIAAEPNNNVIDLTGSQPIPQPQPVQATVVKASAKAANVTAKQIPIMPASIKSVGFTPIAPLPGNITLTPQALQSKAAPAKLISTTVNPERAKADPAKTSDNPLPIRQMGAQANVANTVANQYSRQIVTQQQLSAITNSKEQQRFPGIAYSTDDYINKMPAITTFIPVYFNPLPMMTNQLTAIGSYQQSLLASSNSALANIHPTGNSISTTSSQSVTGATTVNLAVNPVALAEPLTKAYLIPEGKVNLQEIYLLFWEFLTDPLKAEVLDKDLRRLKNTFPHFFQIINLLPYLPILYANANPKAFKSLLTEVKVQESNILFFLIANKDFRSLVFIKKFFPEEFEKMISESIEFKTVLRTPLICAYLRKDVFSDNSYILRLLVPEKSRVLPEYRNQKGFKSPINHQEFIEFMNDKNMSTEEKIKFLEGKTETGRSLFMDLLIISDEQKIFDFMNMNYREELQRLVLHQDGDDGNILHIAALSNKITLITAARKYSTNYAQLKVQTNKIGVNPQALAHLYLNSPTHIIKKLNE